MTGARLAAMAWFVIAALPGRAAGLVASPLTEGGIAAGGDTDVHFFLAAREGDGAVYRLAPLERAKATASITMPSMPGMPPAEPTVHEEGAPGYYGLTTLFPHGGAYRVTITVEGRGSAAFRVSVEDQPDGPAPPPVFAVAAASTPNPPEAGAPAELRLTLTRRGQPVAPDDLVVVHTKPWHLMVMSEDLRWFDHIHPQPDASGRFTVSETFPAGGRYLLLSDVSPRGAGQQFAPVSLVVGGAPFSGAYTLRETPRATSAGGLSVRLDALKDLKAHEDVTLAFQLATPDGRPVIDLQPYLGALGHLILVSADRTRFVHSHPASSDAPQDGTVRFACRFPKPGLYKAWAQFQRDGKVITADFVVSVT